MERLPGTFIVIEGTDGSGKSTQFELLKKRLESAGFAVATFDFPRYDEPSSYFVKRYLNGSYGDADDVGPYTSSLFYALDRFEAAPAIRQALDEGKIVLSNRFTGSNMAHQGTKISTAEERRGFFIWLDNLEFEMLRIPRPDISFVLRVPADKAQELVGQKEKRSYTDKTHDIHEADLSHLERSVTVFDDMTQLFPKDFKRIDCVRSGELLDTKTINNMLWEKIVPLLPPPSAAKPAPAKATTPDTPIASQEAPPAPPAQPQFFELQNVSELLLQKIERIAGTVEVEYAPVTALYVPKNLGSKLAETYQSQMESLLRTHAKIVERLAVRGATAAEAHAAARSVLPLAATATIRLASDAAMLERLITGLLNDQLPEAQAAGATLMAQIIKSDPSLLKNDKKPAKLTALEAVRALAQEFLVEHYAAEQAPVQLLAAWPRNEIDLVADMLYAHSGLPLRAIEQQISSWPLNRKLAVFEAYIGDSRPGPALERAHYSWDLVSSFDTFSELQRQPSESLELQTLTPRYGYDMPQLVEDADLSDIYESCFDLSLALHSALQKAGHPLEAQYATLRGHNQRWKAVYNANQLLQLSQTVTGPDKRAFLQQMYQKIAEAHPTLAESLNI